MKSLTASQVKWASKHDWFISSSKLAGRDGYKVIVADRADGIELNYYDFDDLKEWAGY